MAVTILKQPLIKGRGERTRKTSLEQQLTIMNEPSGSSNLEESLTNYLKM